MSVVPGILRRLERALCASDATGMVTARLRLPRSMPSDSVDWLGGFETTRPDEKFYWSHPHEGIRILGVGAVRQVETRGSARFCDASKAVGDLMAGISLIGDDGPANRGPLVLGGFEFDDAGFARLLLPEVLLVERDRELWLSVTQDAGGALSPRAARLVETLIGDGGDGIAAQSPCGFERDGPSGMASGPEYRVQSDRSHADYRAQVESARRAIASGDLEKVVVARSLRVTHDGRFDLASLLRRLAQLYPTCVTFAVSRPGQCFLGATPELLVARAGSAVRSGAVAGSARRGRTPEEDARLGKDLRESKKEQEEHAVVVRAIADALAPVCADLCVPEAPRLLRIEGIQHLETPIEGELRETSAHPSVIDLAARLHPTPAVGGAPRAAALDWIARCEGLDRKGYAGPVGFVDREGGGEFRVALRSALVRARGDSDEALLFAGAGIVADSQPSHELEETRIKLRALLAPLTEI